MAPLIIIIPLGFPTAEPLQMSQTTGSGDGVGREGQGNVGDGEMPPCTDEKLDENTVRNNHEKELEAHCSLASETHLPFAFALSFALSLAFALAFTL